MIHKKSVQVFLITRQELHDDVKVGVEVRSDFRVGDGLKADVEDIDCDVYEFCELNL